MEIYFQILKVAKITQPGSNMKVSGLTKGLRDNRMTLYIKKHCSLNNVGCFEILPPFFHKESFGWLWHIENYRSCKKKRPWIEYGIRVCMIYSEHNIY
jgi:hypothetical protein